MSEQEQAVATETDAGATPPADGASGAQDETLDALLAEYDSTVEGEEPKPEPKTEEAGKEKSKPGFDVKSEIRSAIAEEEARRKSAAEFQDTIKNLKGDDLSHIPDDLVEGYLEAKARKDPRLLNAWATRHQSPEKWNRILGNLSKEFRSITGQNVDRDQTDTVDTVVAAVRGASTKTASTPQALGMNDVSSLSDSEFAKLKASMGA